MTTRHREYADAAWALPGLVLDRLEQIAEGLVPPHARPTVARLFANDGISLGDIARRDDPEAYNTAKAQRRSEAIGRVLEDERLDGVAALAAGTDSPHLVGAALASHSPYHDNVMLCWLQEDDSRGKAAFAYFARRLRGEEASALDELLGRAVDRRAGGRSAAAVGDPELAMDKLAESDDATVQAYWQAFVPSGLGYDFRAVGPTASGLLSVGRFSATLDLLSLYFECAQTEELAHVAMAAFESPLAADAPDPEIRVLSSFDLGRVLGPPPPLP